MADHYENVRLEIETVGGRITYDSEGLVEADSPVGRAVTALTETALIASVEPEGGELDIETDEAGGR